MTAQGYHAVPKEEHGCKLCRSKGERGWLLVVENFISLTLQHLTQCFHKAGGDQEAHSVLT